MIFIHRVFELCFYPFALLYRTFRYESPALGLEMSLSKENSPKQGSPRTGAPLAKVTSKPFMPWHCTVILWEDPPGSSVIVMEACLRLSRRSAIAPEPRPMMFSPSKSSTGWLSTSPVGWSTAHGEVRSMPCRPSRYCSRAGRAPFRVQCAVTGAICYPPGAHTSHELMGDKGLP